MSMVIADSAEQRISSPSSPKPVCPVSLNPQNMPPRFKNVIFVTRILPLTLHGCKSKRDLFNLNLSIRLSVTDLLLFVFL